MSKSNRLKEILNRHGSKQTWLAEKSGVPISTINDLVHQKKSPTLDTARKIARALNMEIGEIWPEEDGE